MHSKSSLTNRAGFSLLSVVVGVALIGGVTAAVVIGVRSVTTARLDAEAVTRQSAEAGQMTEEIRTGTLANPATAGANGTVTYDATKPVHSTVISGGAQQASLRTGVDAVGAVRSDSNAQTNAFGYLIGTTAPGAWSPTTLIAPSFGVTPPLTSWPAAGIVVPNERNPSGTHYRYTTDGSEPMETSPEWDFTKTWSPWEIPALLTLRAFNDDPAWLPSASTTLTITGLVNLAYARQDGTTSVAFTYADVTGGGNPVTITVDQPNAPAANLVWDTGAAVTAYTGPFTPNLTAWYDAATGSGDTYTSRLLLGVRGQVPTFTSHPHISVRPLVVQLATSPVPLPTPTLVVSGPVPVLTPSAFISGKFLHSGYPTPKLEVTFAPNPRVKSVVAAPTEGDPARYEVTVE